MKKQLGFIAQVKLETGKTFELGHKDIAFDEDGNIYIERADRSWEDYAEKIDDEATYEFRGETIADLYAMANVSIRD